MSRCRAESFYLSAQDKRSFADWDVVAVLPNGDAVPIKHRGDVRKIQLTNPHWDGQVQLVNVYAENIVHLGFMDANTVEGKPHLDPARVTLAALANENITDVQSIGMSAKEIAHILLGDPKFGGAGAAPAIKTVGQLLTSNRPWAECVNTLAFVSAASKTLDPGRTQHLLEFCVHNQAGAWAPLTANESKVLSNILDNYSPATQLALLKDLWDTAHKRGWSRVVNPLDDIDEFPGLADEENRYDWDDRPDLPCVEAPEELVGESKTRWLLENREQWLAEKIKNNPDRFDDGGRFVDFLCGDTTTRLDVEDFFALDLITLRPTDWEDISQFFYEAAKKDRYANWEHALLHPQLLLLAQNEEVQGFTYDLIDGFSKEFQPEHLERLESDQLQHFAASMLMGTRGETVACALAKVPSTLRKWMPLVPYYDRASTALDIDRALAKDTTTNFSVEDARYLLQYVTGEDDLQYLSSYCTSTQVAQGLVELNQPRVTSYLAANPHVVLPVDAATEVLLKSSISGNDAQSMLCFQGALVDFVKGGGKFDSLTFTETATLLQTVETLDYTAHSLLFGKSEAAQQLLLAAGKQKQIDTFFQRVIEKGASHTLQPEYLRRVSESVLRKTTSSVDEDIVQLAGKSGRYSPNQLPESPAAKLIKAAVGAQKTHPEKPKKWSELLPLNPEMDKEYHNAENLPSWELGQMWDDNLKATPIITDRELHKNATYMGNCTYGYRHELATGNEVMYQITDASSRTVYNAHFTNDTYSGSWEVGEINSRFNNMDVPAAVRIAADDIIVGLNDTAYAVKVKEPILHKYQEKDLEDVQPVRAKTKRKRGRRGGR